jgi:1-acyl-sn-glycerol-3-phosphate acyltransferase
VRATGWSEIAGAAVLVANHRSVFDIPVLASLVPPPVVFVARRDLFEVPIVGGVLSRGGHVPVDRRAGEDSRLVLERSLDHLRGGGKVVFFAEGTRSESAAVRPLHAGAFLAALQAGCPLVPVALAGTGRIVPKGRRVMRPGAVAVSFLAPLAVDEQSARPAGRRRVRDRLAAEVRRLERTADPGAGRPVP